MRGVRFLAGAGQIGVEGWRPTSGRWPSSIPARSMIEGHRTLELKLFAGKLDLSKLGFAEKASVRMAHASEGDYRDWQAIDDWAAAIAHQLQQGRVGAGGPEARA